LNGYVDNVADDLGGSSPQTAPFFHFFIAFRIFVVGEGIETLNLVHRWII